MIKPGEIQKKSTEAGVRDQQIEKDYVISWILQGIAVHDKLSRIIVFKGGTVLWYLLEIYGLNIDFYINEFKNKCIMKKLNPNDFFEKLEQRLPQYKARWQKSIKDQIKELPEFKQVERETKKHLRKLKV